MRRVGITGFGVVSPIGSEREVFWQCLARGESGIACISRFDCSSFAVQLAGEVKDILSLEPAVARLAAHDIKIAFAVEASRQALAQAGLGKLDNDTLLHLGTSLESFSLDKLVDEGRVDFAAAARRCLDEEQPPIQIPLDTSNELLASLFGEPGLLLTNCSACAASAQAIGHAFRNIRNGRFKRAVCGGFDSMINPLGVGGFQALGALSTDNARGEAACRPFDASRSGAVLGEGAAVFVLEDIAAAKADGKPVLAEICGYGSTLDAYNLSAPDPGGEGAERAMRAALEDATVAPEWIAHINAHGTGTWLNDQVEATAIRNVFAGVWGNIPVSATKSVTGHMIGAAGAVELGACLLPLLKNILPPNPHLKKAGKGCELNHVTEIGVPYNGEFVLSNSFGFGGQNASLVLRRYNG